MKTKYNGWQNLAIQQELSFLSIIRKDKKGRIISAGVEVY